MSNRPFSEPPDERTLDLLKDGGRKVMDGGNAYEDDLEREESPSANGARSRPVLSHQVGSAW